MHKRCGRRARRWTVVRASSLVFVAGLVAAGSGCARSSPQSGAPLAGPFTFQFTTVVDSTDAFPPPPTGGLFAIPGGNPGLPALDGANFVFNAGVQFSGFDALFDQTDCQSQTRLVDTSVPVPSGMGDLTVLSPYRVSGSRVIFGGQSSTDSQEGGYYSVPVGGGALALLANQGTTVPGSPPIGGTFGRNTFQDNVGLSGGTVVFERNGGSGGIYSVGAAGGAVSVVADGNVVFCDPTINSVAGGFGAPDLSGTTVAGLASGNAGGFFIVFTVPLSGITGVADPCAQGALKENNATIIADHNTTIPGTARTFDGTHFGQPLIDGTTVVFPGAATTNNTVDLSGLYASTGGVLTKLVDSNTAVPGGTGNFALSSFLAEVSIRDGLVAFRGIDAASHTGYYVVPTTGGAITKVVADGDTITLTDGAMRGPIHFFQPTLQRDSLGMNAAGGLSLAMRLSDPTRDGYYRVDINGSAIPDGGCVAPEDMATTPSPDLVIVPDLVVVPPPVDLAAPTDFALPADLAMAPPPPPDLASPPPPPDLASPPPPPDLCLLPAPAPDLSLP
jgi:hypothetical protein